MDCSAILKKKEIKISVPCRIDLGGTLDISTFFLPLNYLGPSTFNIALDMRTEIQLSAFKPGFVRVCSRGFKSAEFKAGQAVFDHPLGLMFAVAAYFNATGVQIKINSASPPRSALGGSSAAAVAITAAFLKIQQTKAHGGGQENNRDHNPYQDKDKNSCDNKDIDPEKSALIAHYIESSVAGVPCGLQDQLAAAFGGVNTWHWSLGASGPEFIQEKIFKDHDGMEEFNKNILVAYCGIPHVSKDINKRWVHQFLSAENRDKWEEVCTITAAFSQAVKLRQYSAAGALMNRETRLRLSMTPDVLDQTGKDLFESAEKSGCGSRFTGAGAGGCVWAIGPSDNIEKLKKVWKTLLEEKNHAALLDTKIDPVGILEVKKEIK